MIVYREAAALRRQMDTLARQDRVTGFVPTMGALHEGHLSLIESSKAGAGFTVCSIFVNPAQFNDPADYNKYPVTTQDDIAMLESAGTDALFLPKLEEIYPDGTGALEQYNLGFLETVLEGKYRPGHFQGVCQVMSRLLEVVRPNHLFMGQKDYQQCMVVKRLLQLKGWEHSIMFHVCPTVREADGLAMSSRNRRLDPAQREKAPLISAALRFTRDNLQPGDLSSLTKTAWAMLEDAGFRVDYFEIAHADTLEPVTHWDGQSPLVALVAAFLGDVRLIDNMAISNI
jgi:pantoate--beta-alanine ligase